MASTVLCAKFSAWLQYITISEPKLSSSPSFPLLSQDHSWGAVSDGYLKGRVYEVPVENWVRLISRTDWPFVGALAVVETSTPIMINGQKPVRVEAVVEDVWRWTEVQMFYYEQWIHLRTRQYVNRSNRKSEKVWRAVLLACCSSDVTRHRFSNNLHMSAMMVGSKR